MARGPKHKPDKVKILKGTMRAGKSKAVPGQDKAELVAPLWLPDTCYKHFVTVKDRLREHGLDSASWTEAVALIAMRLQEIEECNRVIKDEGRTYKTIGTNGQELTKVNPIVNQKNEALRHLQSLLSEFGLTPSAINKVGKVDKGASKDPWADF